MHTFHRRIYRLLLRLHPAAFRDEFAHEMALDFGARNGPASVGAISLMRSAAKLETYESPSTPQDAVAMWMGEIA
jgi:hypothetical protein